MYAGRRCATLILAVTAAAAVGLAVVPIASAASARRAGDAQYLATSNPWGKAQEVPGTAALNKGHDAQITSVSCASAGNCSAGGYYASAPEVLQAFVVSEVKGTWRKAEEVPGLAALNKNGDAEITSVSCASAGNCSAGGWYAGGAFAGVAFVVSQVNGTWRKAEEVPGLAAHNNGFARIASVSCASAGNCSAAGSYQDESFASQAFVVSEVGGRWRRAEEVPGTAALNKDEAGATSVSCASAGNCSAGGYYTSGSDGEGVDVDQAFVVSEVRGRWRKAQGVPGTAALNRGGLDGIASVSCGSAGNCSAGGYSGLAVGPQAFIISEVRGRWRKAKTVPGTAGDEAATNSVSCASAGNCVAGGSYAAGGRQLVAFVVSEVSGRWRTAQVVPGLAALSRGGLDATTSVSCASAGNCSAGGAYQESNASRAFVVSEVGGRWRRAEEVPGVAALGKGQAAGVTSVSCTRAGHCSAGGFYGVFVTDAFVVSRT